MPFPLAHPAAILPFRRYCPRPLSFPALVLGSLVPDVGYFFEGTGVEDFSHSFPGSFGFCLPVGLVLLGLFYFLARVFAKYLPGSPPRIFQPLSHRRAGAALAIIVSLLIGIWTHLLLDSLTHKDGWAVQHLPLLQKTITQFDGRNVRVCHLLWYGGSCLGVAWLYLAFRASQAGQSPQGPIGSWQSRVLEAGLVASLVLPIELAHHLVRGFAGDALVAFLSLALVIGILVRSQWRRLHSSDREAEPTG